MSANTERYPLLAMRVRRCIQCVLLLATLLANSSCVPVVLPVPGSADEPRFTDEQLSALQPGKSTREAVYAVLGPPSVPPFHASMGPHLTPSDFVRRNGELVVYTWKQRGAGRMLSSWDKPSAEGPPAFKEKRFVLFLRFNEDGLLISKQVVQEEYQPAFHGSHTQPLCNDAGVCVEVFFAHDVSLHFGALTVASPSHLPKPGTDQCSVVMWLNRADWTKNRGKNIFGTSPGIGLDYTLSPELYAQRYTTWFPVDSFVELTMYPGKRVIRFSNPVRLRADNWREFPFECVAAHRSWIELGAEDHEVGLGVILRPVEARAGAEHVKGLRQLLLRDQ